MIHWRKGITERGELRQIVGDDGAYLIWKYRAPRISYGAFGPVGSQSVDFIAECTAAAIRETWRQERRAQDIALSRDRAFLGMFSSADEARAACEGHASRA